MDVDDGMKGPCAANLHNAVTVSQDRLGKRVGSLSIERMQAVCVALRFSLGWAQRAVLVKAKRALRTASRLAHFFVNLRKGVFGDTVWRLSYGRPGKTPEEFTS